MLIDRIYCLVLIIHSDSWRFCLLISPLVPLHPFTSLCLPYLSLRFFQDTTAEGVLSLCGCSHSDTHYLKRHMAGCGCHEILIESCITVLFLSNFSLYPIQLWFWWLSFSNHSFRLISIQYSVHHSDSARTHQSCNQKPFISTFNWKQAQIRRHRLFSFEPSAGIHCNRLSFKLIY